MGKKSVRSKTSPSTVPAAPEEQKDANRTEAKPAAPSPEVIGKRMQGGILLIVLVGVMATLDRRRLALAANIALPEHLPLLAPIVAFGWYVRWKWLQAGRKGMRPIIRVVGFTGILLISMGLLPFNTMVNMYETSFLSREECTKLVAATEDVIARSDFIPGSGRDLSDDVPLGSFPSEVSSMVIHAMNSRLLPFLALHYPGRPVVKDYHVVKYSPIGSVGLGPDQVDLISKGDLAISVELSPSEDFVGGGIWFRTLGKSLAITYGAALIFPARVW